MVVLCRFIGVPIVAAIVWIVVVIRLMRVSMAIVVTVILVVITCGAGSPFHFTLIRYLLTRR